MWANAESIMIGTRQRLRTLHPIASPIIAGTPIPFSDTIKTLGVTLDQKFDLKEACFLTIPHYSFLHPCAPSH